MVHELLESHLSVFVLNYKSVPQGPGFAQIFGFGGHDGVWEGHEGQGQVSESVLEHLNLKKITGKFTIKLGKSGSILFTLLCLEKVSKIKFEIRFCPAIGGVCYVSYQQTQKDFRPLSATWDRELDFFETFWEFFWEFFGNFLGNSLGNSLGILWELIFLLRFCLNGEKEMTK